MKKIIGLGLLVLCAATLGSLTNPVINHKDNDLQTSTIDFVNEKNGIKKANVSTQVNNNKFSASKIYAQTAVDDEGFEYLRFATALRGKFDNVTYTRHIEGLEDKTDPVTTIYKGISANGVTTYSNGTDFVNYDVTSTKEYYWACYTIKFNKDSIYKNTDITVTLNVDGATTSRTTNLTAVKNNIDGQLSLQDQINKGNIDISKYNVTTINNHITSDAGIYIQGLTTDGNNIYFSITDNIYLFIRKYNPITKEITDVSDKLKMDTTSTSDGNHIKYINNKIYIIANNGQVKIFDLSTKEFIEGPTFTDLVGTIKDIGYNEKTKQFITLNTEGLIQIYDNFKAVNSFNVGKNSSIGGGAIKSIQNDNNYVYVSYIANNYRGMTIKTFNYVGSKINEYEITNSAFMSSCEKDFNCPNFVFSNNKIYLSGITWTNAHGELYELDFNAKTSNYIKNDIKWNEYEGYASIYNQNITYNYDLVNSVFNVSGYPYVHGACNDITDSRYGYFAANKGNNQKGIIIKYDFVDNTIVGYSKEYTAYKTEDNIKDKYTYTDNANIFMYNGKIYALDSYGKFMSVNANDITGIGTGDITQDDTTLDFKLTEQIKSVTYSSDEHRFAVNTTAGNLYIFSEDLTQINKIEKVGTAQTIYSEGERIYMFFKHEDKKIVKTETITDSEGKETTVNTNKYYDTATINSYDWDGTKISTKKYGTEDDPIGASYTKTGNRCTNLQNMIILNGDLFITRLVHSGGSTAGTSGGYLYKLNIKEKEQLNSLITNKTLGEYLETTTETNFKVVEKEKNSTFNGFCYIQDAVTVKDEIYYAYTNSNNTEMCIKKVNPLTGQFITSKTPINLGKPSDSTSISDLGKLFVYNDKLWFVEYNSKKVNAIDLDTLDIIPNETKEFTMLPEKTVIKDVMYNEFTDTFAILGTEDYQVYNLYFVNSNAELIKTTQVNGWSGSIKSLNGNNDYLYVSYSGDGKNNINFLVYDYEGNFIKNATIASDIMPTENFNTQAITEYKGMIVLVGLGWSTNSGGFIYYVNMK